MARLLIANRGEIARRICRAARRLEIETVALRDPGDGAVHHVGADEVVSVGGPSSFTDPDRLVAIAVEHGCDLLHPGYGFRSEDPAFARAVWGAGLGWVGPSPEALDVFGDKAASRALAEEHGVPVLPGVVVGADDDGSGAHSFVAEHRPVMVKAVGAGGGRGLRRVDDPDDLVEAVAAARREAGAGRVLVERFVAAAKHVEVQVLGDGANVLAVGVRDCSVQRRNQKVIELSGAHLPEPVVADVCAAAERLSAAVGYRGAGTVEFLVAGENWWFLEVNPRIQVEHPVTEEERSIDLVAAQLRLVTEPLDQVVPDVTHPERFVIEARLTAERLRADGGVVSSSGTIDALVLPSGPGVRVDHAVAAGSEIGSAYDSLLAKIVVSGSDLADARRRLADALAETVVDGVATNLGVLRRIVAHPGFGAETTTTFVADHLADLADAERPRDTGTPGALVAPVTGSVVRLEVDSGHTVEPGATVAVLEAMKMEHVVTAVGRGTVVTVHVAVGDVVEEGRALVTVALDDEAGTTDGAVVDVDLEQIRDDLAEVLERHAVGRDDRRPEAVARRHGRGHRTARENLADLVDEGSFVEYGPLAVAAQRKRRSLDDLVANTPADGLVGGIGRIGGHPVAVASYDYMVLAGTQGLRNHIKKDRLFELAERQRLPFVLFAEGGGGRPGDTDGIGVAGLDGPAFHYWARLSGQVPLVSIVNGRCFAGNAALAGCSDVIIATRDTNLGMGGPAMIEGGGLGVFRPEEVGPASEQHANGVIDVLVDDEAEAVAVARRYLSYFTDPATDPGSCPDQRRLRHVVPENRLRVYDVHRAIDALFDDGSVLELRAGWAPGMVTALARVEGRAVGVLANNPLHLAGAIDSDGADKGARFLQLCDAFGLPVISLVDTPGIMVGPEAERTALVRHAARLFVTAAATRVPIGSVVLRKGYGLGAMAMTGGSFRAGVFCVGWPTSEFGGMGLEGAVRLGYRRELEACADDAARRALFDELVARHYQIGKGVNMALHLEIDDVIDPADTRRWLTGVLLAGSVSPQDHRTETGFVDTW